MSDSGGSNRRRSAARGSWGREAREWDRADFETISVESYSAENLGSSSSSSSSSSSGDSDGGGDGGGQHARALFSGLELPLSITDARATLWQIFDTTDWHIPEGRGFVFNILSRYPALAAETFDDPDGEPRRPLSQLLSARANLKMIQSVFQMHPTAISQPQGSIGDLPLHDACWYGNSPEVVQFVATEYPEALTILNDSRRLPIHDAIRTSRMSVFSHDDNLTSSETIRFLVDFYPDSMKTRDNDGKSLLESALFHGYGQELLAFLAESYPSSSGMESFICGGGYSTGLDLSRVRAILPIFDKISYFRCDPPSWTPEGFALLVSSLAHNETVESMELSIPGSIFMGSQDAQGGFLDLLERNGALQRLAIDFSRQSSNVLQNVADVCLRVMGTALENNTTSGIQRLELARMLMTNRYNLAHFLVSAEAPKELVLEQVTIRLTTGLCGTFPEDPKGLIESVILGNCPMDQSTLEDIFQLLAMMPSLKSLKLEFDPSAPGAAQVRDLSLTIPLIAVLRQNKLERVELSTIYDFDLRFLVGILQNNTSLETLNAAPQCLNVEALFEILKYNTSLKHCSLEPAGRHDRVRDKTIQLMRLNRFGRGKIREADTTKLQFLMALIAANADTSLKLPIDKFNMMWGLLRENPSVWSTTG